MRKKDGNSTPIYILEDMNASAVVPPREYEAPSWTPLMRAAFTGDIETAKQHLDEKNKMNSNGDTALMIAARMKHEDIVELLDPTDEDGVTALMRAAARRNTEMVELLVPLQKGKQTLGGTMLNDLWIRKGGTALIVGAAHGHAEVVRVLAEHEGGMKDDFSRTALIHAAEKGHAHCVELLAEKEGGMQDKYGYTALMHTVRDNRMECVKLLLEKEGNIQDKDGVTALMLAACNRDPDYVKLLLEKEGGMQDNDGWTALMRAVFVGHTESVRLLAEREKDMKTIREWFGYPPGTTALDIAKERGHTEIASILSG
ncbi:Calmodulin [Giardia duodenalis]|uniref:Calmodulin n=1 Tax=Giardia intestinalis TaxID=5741 RepID=V6TS01_GIAIN|nr:Calmodulin [Giardia intestinalis]